MPITTGAVLGGGALLGGVTGGLLGGKGAKNAANAAASSQERIAAAQLKFQRESRDLQIQARDHAVQLAQASPLELGQLGVHLDLQDKAISGELDALKRNQELLDASDPAIKEAGNQALQLLKGQTSAAAAPVMAARERQRSKLEETLRDRLGPDYAQSSAGASALRNFDNDTSVVASNTLGQLLGVAERTSTNLNPVTQVGNAFNTLAAINTVGMNAAQNITNRTVNAFTGNPVNQQLDFNGAYAAAQTAGNAAMIGSQIGPNAISGVSNALGQFGGQLLGYGLSQGNRPYNPFSNSGFSFPAPTGE